MKMKKKCQISNLWKFMKRTIFKCNKRNFFLKKIFKLISKLVNVIDILYSISILFSIEVERIKLQTLSFHSNVN